MLPSATRRARAARPRASRRRSAQPARQAPVPEETDECPRLASDACEPLRQASAKKPVAGRARRERGQSRRSAEPMHEPRLRGPAERVEDEPRGDLVGGLLLVRVRNPPDARAVSRYGIPWTSMPHSASGAAEEQRTASRRKTEHRRRRISRESRSAERPARSSSASKASSSLRAAATRSGSRHFSSR